MNKGLAWTHAVLLIVALSVAPRSEAFSMAAIDRAVAQLDLKAESRAYLAKHRTSPAPRGLPYYAAEVTVKDRVLSLAPEVSTHKTLPLTGTGGSQGPSFDSRTGIPWWR